MVFYIVIVIMGIVVNLVLCGVLLRRKYWSISEYFIFNLVIIDLMICVVGILLDIVVILV